MTSEKKKSLVFEHVYPERMATHYVSGAFGHLTPFHFNIDFYVDSNHRKDFTERVAQAPNGAPSVTREGPHNNHRIREVKTRIQMSPLAAKQLADWIYHHLKQSGIKFENDSQKGGPQYV